MAGSGVERRDGKLESFLLKHLPLEEYERLLTRQPCVAVVGKSEKPAHRHAVVGHCRLYLIDVPPRNLKMTLQLRDMESVHLLNEPAEFLQGKEKDEAVHVQICFTREVKKDKGFLGSLGDLSPALGRQFASTGKATERTSLPSPLLTRNRGSFQDESGSMKKASSVQSLNRHLKTRSCSPVHPTKLRASVVPGNSQQGPHITTLSHVPTSRMRSQPQERATSVQRHDNRKRTLLEKSLKPQSLKFPTNPCESMEDISRLSSNDSLFSSQSSPSLLSDQTTLSSVSSSKEKGALRLSTQYLRSSEQDVSKSEQLGKQTEREVLDLYILTPITDFYQHLCTARQDRMMALTLGQSLQPIKSPGPVPSDHFLHHFHTLRQELVSSSSVQKSAQLVQELCAAGKKYFIIKRLFWESHGLPEYLVEALKYKVSEKQTGVQYEIEYLVIVLDLLYEMLRETHGLQRRRLALTSNSGNCLRQLTNAVIHLVSILSKQGEVVEKSCGILSEIFRLSQQMRWPCSREGVVSPEWLLDILARHPKIREFCEAVITRVALILHRHHIEPRDFVSLYHIIHVIDYIVDHSRPLLALIRTQFAEEFKYFISVTQARGKLPATCPLTSQILTLLQHAKSRVLKN